MRCASHTPSEDEIITLAFAHKHDEHVTYEAEFNLARLTPKNSPVQSVVKINSNKCLEEKVEDCAYTYVCYPSMNRLSWQTDTPEEASAKLRAMKLECFRCV